MSPFRIYYPGGGTIELVGRLRTVDLGGGLGVAPGILTGRGQLALLDPRAVILQGSAVVVEPRHHEARLAPWVRLWLAAHPEWPRVVTEACG